MTSDSFTCERCGATFDLSAATRAKYPGWTPKLCTRCRKETPSTARAGGTRAGQMLTTTQIRERFTEGPDSGVFTDGSCSGNPGPGGWGAVRVDRGQVVAEAHGSEPQTTNNRMELTAMIAGLRMLEPAEVVDVYSDSRLVVQTLTQWAAGWERRGWKRSDGEVKNLDLVQTAYALAKARPGARIQWIRAHDGSLWNEYADSLSTAYQRAEV